MITFHFHRGNSSHNVEKVFVRESLTQGLLHICYICFFFSLNLTGIWSHIMKVTNFHIIYVIASLKFYFSSVQLLCCFFHVSSQGKYCRILAAIANKWLLGFVQIQILQTWVNWNKTNWDRILIQLVVVEHSNSQLTEAWDHRNFCYFLTSFSFYDSNQFYILISSQFGLFTHEIDFTCYEYCDTKKLFYFFAFFSGSGGSFWNSSGVISVWVGRLYIYSTVCVLHGA